MRGVKSFADIPAEVRRRVDSDERLALIFLDAFGLEFLERDRDHPLIERLEVTPVSAQFPSTTTAHVTTMHFGVPVHEHGLYEWTCSSPRLQRSSARLLDRLRSGGDAQGSTRPVGARPGANVLSVTWRALRGRTARQARRHVQPRRDARRQHHRLPASGRRRARTRRRVRARGVPLRVAVLGSDRSRWTRSRSRLTRVCRRLQALTR